jgi:predicted DNA-binding protein
VITLILNAASQRRLADIARLRGTSEADLARHLIETSLDDIDDIAMATNRLENPLSPLNVADARAALGLDQGNSFS